MYMCATNKQEEPHIFTSLKYLYIINDIVLFLTNELDVTQN